MKIKVKGIEIDVPDSHQVTVDGERVVVAPPVEPLSPILPNPVSPIQPLDPYDQRPWWSRGTVWISPNSVGTATNPHAFDLTEAYQ